MTARKQAHIDLIRTSTLEVLRENLQVSDDQLVQAADAIVGAMQQHFSGERIYIATPKYDRDKVLADFNGRNRKEVCRTHKISRSTFFNIIGKKAAKK